MANHVRRCNLHNCNTSYRYCGPTQHPHSQLNATHTVCEAVDQQIYNMYNLYKMRSTGNTGNARKGETRTGIRNKGGRYRAAGYRVRDKDQEQDKWQQHLTPKQHSKANY